MYVVSKWPDRYTCSANIFIPNFLTRFNHQIKKNSFDSWSLRGNISAVQYAFVPLLNCPRNIPSVALYCNRSPVLKIYSFDSHNSAKRLPAISIYRKLDPVASQLANVHKKTVNTVTISLCISNRTMVIYMTISLLPGHLNSSFNLKIFDPWWTAIEELWVSIFTSWFWREKNFLSIS